jgi:hypothetical protein
MTPLSRRRAGVNVGVIVLSLLWVAGTWFLAGLNFIDNGTHADPFFTNDFVVAFELVALVLAGFALGLALIMLLPLQVPRLFALLPALAAGAVVVVTIGVQFQPTYDGLSGSEPAAKGWYALAVLGAVVITSANLVTMLRTTDAPALKTGWRRHALLSVFVLIVLVPAFGVGDVVFNNHQQTDLLYTREARDRRLLAREMPRGASRDEVVTLLQRHQLTVQETWYPRSGQFAGDIVGSISANDGVFHPFGMSCPVTLVFSFRADGSLFDFYVQGCGG